MRRRRKNRKQVRMVVGLFICLLLMMSVGYAAFSTNLTLNAKGNILTTPEKCFTVMDNGDGTGTITNYDKTCGDKVRIPNKINNLLITKIADGYFDSSTSTIHSVFTNTGITKIILPENLKYIGVYAFSKTNIHEIIFPNSVETVASHAFAWSKLEKVEMNEGLKTIGGGAFEYCNLTSLYIPKTVTNLSQAFGANLIEGDAAFVYARNADGSEDKTRLLSFGDRNRKEVTVPNGVISIGSYCFVSDIGIEVLNIPDSVVRIDSFAFYSMDNLKIVNIGSGITSINAKAFGVVPKLETININRKTESVIGSPWGANTAKVNWLGTN